MDVLEDDYGDFGLLFSDDESLLSDYNDDNSAADNESDKEDVDHTSDNETTLDKFAELVQGNPAVPKTFISSVLKIFQSHSCFKEFPLDYRALLHTPRNYVFRDVNPGQYFHFGLQNYLEKVVSVPIENVLEIMINIDGIPISKSSGSQLWPILAMIKNGIKKGIPSS